jgi:hypothetical protein
VVEDAKKQLGEIGHSIEDFNMTGHNFVFNKPRRESWRSFSFNKIWDTTPEMIHAEHGAYLSKFDAMMACYPPLAIRLLDATDKPLINWLPVRYDLWLTDNRDRWESYQKWFLERTAQKRLHVASNSLYDSVYCKYFTGLEVPVIPSICDYVGVSYAPEDRPSLVWDSRSEKVTSLFLGEIPELKTPRGYYGGKYEWANLVKHRAIIHVPYNASIMSFFEHYWMNIPLFVPTRAYMMDLKVHYGAIGEITHAQCSNMAPPGSFGKGTFDAPDPNEYNSLDSLYFWSQWWDMYVMPHITYFNSLKDLREKLSTMDLRKISENMREHNQVRKTSALKKWAEFIGGIK